MNTHAGQAWVGLRVGLGHPPHPHVQRKKGSPSRHRRQARQAEARQLGAVVAGTEEVTARTNAVEKHAEKVIAREDEIADTVEELLLRKKSVNLKLLKK